MLFSEERLWGVDEVNEVDEVDEVGVVEVCYRIEL